MFLGQEHRLIRMFLSGFGWVNASYVYGLTIVNTHSKALFGFFLILSKAALCIYPPKRTYYPNFIYKG